MSEKNSFSPLSWMASAVALAVLVLCIYGLWNGLHSSDPGVLSSGRGASSQDRYLALVDGQDFELVPKARRTDPQKRKMIEAPTRVVLPSLTSHINLLLHGAVSVVFRGQGELKVGPDGLKVVKGRLVSNFQKTPQGFKFRVPSAVLAVRGTEIRFELTGSASSIELIEGAVDILPDGAPNKRFSLKPGEKARFVNKLWVRGTSVRKEPDSKEDPGREDPEEAPEEDPEEATPPGVAGTGSKTHTSRDGFQD